ncbi:MAG: kinase [Deltaproteobacteria bacterium]|nr:kinase [Deltaproteobacteria bacterium]
MIITRTPYRISFFGGGTDYPNWYREHGGVVISTTINKYCHIYCRYLPPYFKYKYLLRYVQREEANTINEIKHPSVRECLKFLNIDQGIEMVYMGDIPAQSGMGSSSSFIVGLLTALYALMGKMVTKRQIANEAIHIEQNLLMDSVGSQDQVAAAFGGFNKIEFGGDRDFYVSPLTLGKHKLQLLHSHLMLFFTGISRNASDIAAEQIRRTQDKKRELRTMTTMVDEAVSILYGDPGGIQDFGKLLNEAWEVKKGITPLISTDRIDAIYEAAMNSGALGGKLLGAGGGGFLLFFVPPEHQPSVRETLKDILYVPFHFECLGSQIVVYSTQEAM